MERFVAVLDGAKSGWNKIDKRKKVLMITFLVSILAFVSIYTYFTQRTEYVTLFSDLELSDAGNIVSDLETKKMKYKLENGGSDILIDKKQVDEYRLQLAMNGMMPENSTGFEIFDDTGLMATEEDREIMYQRALTGELQRSIMSLEAIKSAKVHLVMPEKSIFEKEDKEASASVIVDVKPNQKVTNDMVKGIASLVSGAVDNLPEKNIQVIDSKGNLLSAFLQEDTELNATDIASGYQEIKKQFESELESNLDDLLGSAYGKDKIKISVYADLDFDSEESTIITDQEPVLRSEQVSASGDTIEMQNATGGNIDDNVSNVVESQQGSGSTYERTINNELNSTTTQRIKAPGKVNKLTTSVIYDGELANRDIQSIQNIVASATGYNVERGDVITVEGVIFDKTSEKQLEEELRAIELEELNNRSLFEKYGEYVIFALLSALGIVILIALIRLIFSRRKQKDLFANRELAQGQLAMDLQPEATAMEMLRMANEEDTKQSLNIEVKTDAKEVKAQNYAKDNPEIVADLIKTWIQE